AVECERAVQDTIRLLESCGHEVVEVLCPAFWNRPMTRGIVGGVHRRLELERWGRRIGRAISLDEVEPLTAYWIRQAEAVTAAEYVTVLQKTQEWSRQLVASWRAQCDLLLTPT